MKRTLKRELKVLEIAELEANGTNALVEIAASACDVWALERKSFVWIEAIACNVSQLEHQLLYMRESTKALNHILAPRTPPSCTHFEANTAQSDCMGPTPKGPSTS